MTATQQDSSVDKKSFRFSNLTVRLLTGLVLLPIFIFGMYVGGWVLLALLALVTTLGLLEFYALAKGRQSQGSTLIGIPTGLAVLVVFFIDQPLLSLAVIAVSMVVTFILEGLRHPRNMNRTLWQVMTTLAGVIYVAYPLAFLIAIRAFSEGFLWLMVTAACTWGTDTFAYFGGRYFGKHKLAPKLSPKKTVEGAAVGVVGGFGIALLFLVYDEKLTAASLVLILIAPFVAVLGDLLESAIKRFFKVKDSHLHGLNIIPGHGGVLDRVDALLLVSAFSYLYIILTGIAG